MAEGLARARPLPAGAGCGGPGRGARHIGWAAPRL